jgi:hypothetical protein
LDQGSAEPDLRNLSSVAIQPGRPTLHDAANEYDEEIVGATLPVASFPRFPHVVRIRY